jgi:predicted DNA-binding transcriptional regulator AlpA
MLYCGDVQKKPLFMYHFSATRRDVAQLLKISEETIKRWERSGKFPPHCSVKLGYKTRRYCLELIADWQQNPDDPAAHARSAAALAASLPSNQPSRAGRKSAA